MWRWDRGRMQYFEFDNLRSLAKVAVQHDLRNTDGSTIRSATGLPFLPNRPDYRPWRNYGRVFMLAMLASQRTRRGAVEPTDVARVLAQDGVVTCDEYLHFLAEATMSPSPARTGWNYLGLIRYPLCFTLRYLLAKVSCGDNPVTPINEIIGAYIHSNFFGGEDQTAFIGLLANPPDYVDIARRNGDQIREARESIKFLCQISYLHCNRDTVMVSLAQEDALVIFNKLEPIGGTSDPDRHAEIARLALFFSGGTTHDFFDYQTTTISNELDSGFVEGSKVKRSHVVIERNSGLRHRFFRDQPTAVCDACRLDTKQRYPWTDRVLDLHHALPLSSGTRVDYQTGTLMEDLIAICPTCHRSVHRYYDKYLRKFNRRDFADKAEALGVYQHAKNKIRATQSSP